jgi:hypothetical protein
MLTSARICPPRAIAVLQALVTFENRDAHCIAGGMPIC